MTESVNNEEAHKQVSNEEEAHVEMVTKEPIPIKPVVVKIKDPRKIEAGKKLAAYNKKAKSSKKELAVHSADSSVDDTDSGDGGGGFNITLTTVVAIIGLGLTGVDLYLRHKKMNEKGVKDYKMTTIDYKPLANKMEKTQVGNGVENEKNNKKGVKRVRFEPGME